MDYYFTSTNEAWLNEVNGRGFPPGNVTSRWVEIIKHPERDEWAAVVPDDFMPRLNEIVANEELGSNALGPFTKDQMEAEGWFVQPEGAP